MPWGDCSLRAATRDEVAGDECVELRLMHREHCMHLRRLVRTIAKRFFSFICLIRPESTGIFRSGLERLTRNGLSVGSSIP